MPEGMKPRWWDQRIWAGMGPAALHGLLKGRRRRIAPDRMALVVTLWIFAPTVALLSALQSLFHGRRIRRTALTAPPVFILGCHRTGTTHLHKLLSLVPGLHAPTGYECFSAPHFLVSGGWMPRLLAPLVAPRRPMDGMPNDLAQPQEDDFALLSMGAPTPYRRLAFPDAADGGLDLPDEADIAGERVLAAQETFLKALTLRHGRRIVLKSPFHTARVAALRRRYPDALFVHMVRDLGAVGPSTVNFWRTLEDGHRIGPPLADESRRSAFVGAMFDWMYGRFIADEAKLPPGALLTVRYDDLVADPLAVVRRICTRLPDISAPDLTAARAHLAAVDGFRTNRFVPEPAIYADADLAGTYTARYLAPSTPAR